MRRITRTSFLGLLLVASAGCGGGTKNKETFSLVFPAVEQATVVGDMSMPVTHQIGDSMTGQIARLLVRFDIAALPPGAIIVSATFAINQSFIAGTPWGDLGQVQIDQIDIGPGIDFADWNSASLSGIIGVLSPNSNTAPEVKTANLTSGLQTIVNNNFQLADFRLYFPVGTDGNNDEDRAEFGTGLNATLTVQYQQP